MFHQYLAKQPFDKKCHFEFGHVSGGYQLADYLNTFLKFFSIFSIFPYLRNVKHAIFKCS